jgi:hypothetical protein
MSTLIGLEFQLGCQATGYYIKSGDLFHYRAHQMIPDARQQGVP